MQIGAESQPEFIAWAERELLPALRALVAAYWTDRSLNATVPSMARTKAFDPDAALASALDLFWAQGYDGTSTEDLVAALGINRSSLYGTFGSKRELYCRGAGALPRRRRRAARTGLRRAGRRGARAAAPRTAGDDRRGPPRAHGPAAASRANAALELAPADSGVRNLVAASFRDTRAVLHAELVRARDEGELSPDADVEALTAHFFALLQGIQVVAKGTGDRTLVERAIDSALTAV